MEVRKVDPLVTAWVASHYDQITKNMCQVLSLDISYCALYVNVNGVLLADSRNQFCLTVCVCVITGYVIPSVDPSGPGVDDWNLFEGTQLLHNSVLGLYFDTQSATYFRQDATSGEFVVVDRNNTGGASISRTNSSSSITGVPDVADESRWQPEVR